MSVLLIIVIIAVLFIIYAIYKNRSTDDKPKEEEPTKENGKEETMEQIDPEVDSSMLAVGGEYGNGQGVSATVHWSGPDYKAGDVRETPLPYIYPQTQWMNNQGYTACYPEVASEDNNCDYFEYMDYDEKNTRQTQMRQQRDKKAQEGLASKNAYYYKKNFATELDDYEKKPWWGNDEV